MLSPQLDWFLFAAFFFHNKYLAEQSKELRFNNHSLLLKKLFCIGKECFNNPQTAEARVE